MRTAEPVIAEMHDNDQTDLGLLQRIVARDTAALAELYDRNCRLLFSLLVRIVQDRVEAEEILQEVFVRVWTGAELYDARLGGPKPWLVRLARNRATDRLRARQTRGSAAMPSVNECTAGAGTSTKGVRTPGVVVSDARRARVSDALAGLPAEQRCLIEAAFFEGYTQSELATRFGLPLGTVKTRIRAGMIAIRQRLEHLA
ncbi:MAG TPA: sigma-70 family RNA polymerase sigma factor [Vicinamibacterales bacterium]